MGLLITTCQKGPSSMVNDCIYVNVLSTVYLWSMLGDERTFFAFSDSRVDSASHKSLSSISSSDNGMKNMTRGNSLHLLLNEARNLALLTFKKVLRSTDKKRKKKEINTERTPVLLKRAALKHSAGDPCSEAARRSKRGSGSFKQHTNASLTSPLLSSLRRPLHFCFSHRKLPGLTLPSSRRIYLKQGPRIILTSGKH